MERLTKKRQGQNVIPLRQDGKTAWALSSAGMGDKSTMFLYGAYTDRLAAYEDTGLEPEEIRKSNEMLRAFIEHNRTTEYPRTLDWLLRITKAEAEGRLLVLPCKVGDTVYVLVKEGKIKKYIVSGIIIDQNNTWIDIREIENPYGGGLLNALQFGVDVFCTLEEAEDVLKQEVKSDG